MLFNKSLSTLFCFLMLKAGFAYAEPFIPKNNAFVVAEWAVDKQVDERGGVLRKVAWHIEQGQYPGQSNKHYGRAYALLNSANEGLRQNPLYLYQLARVQQHEHEFDSALENLDKLLAIDAKNQNAWLLKANIYLAQGLYDDAQDACKAITNLSEPIVLNACMLEVSGYTDALQESYDTLSSIALERVKQGDVIALWLSQILAEQSLRLNSLPQAADWLSHVPLERAPLSLLVLWADVMLAMGDYAALYRELNKILEVNDTYDEALLIRMVIAENRLGTKRWSQPLENQMILRIQRQDLYHAGDLARYFIDIKPDAIQAKYWADINWQRTKLYEDKQLLERANAMNKEDESK